MSASNERGSSLFIKRVADLEGEEEKDNHEGHFRDAEGQQIEMNVFEEEAKDEEEGGRHQIEEIVEDN